MDMSGLRHHRGRQTRERARDGWVPFLTISDPFPDDIRPPFLTIFNPFPDDIRPHFLTTFSFYAHKYLLFFIYSMHINVVNIININISIIITKIKILFISVH